MKFSLHFSVALLYFATLFILRFITIVIFLKVEILAGTSKIKPFGSSSKRIIHNVIKVYDEESRIGELLVPINQPSKQVSKWCQFIRVYNIGIQANEKNDPEFNSPGKKKQKQKTVLSVNLDSFDIDVIRTVYDFYVNEKRVPMITKLLPLIKEEIIFS